MKKCFSLCLALIFATTIFSGCSTTQMAAGGGGGIVVIGGIVGGVGAFMSGTADLVKVLKDNGLIEENLVEQKDPSDDKKVTDDKEAEKDSAVKESEEVSNKANLETKDKILSKVKVEESKQKTKQPTTNSTSEPNKSTSTKKSVKYEKFTDITNGFSFDYPVEGAEDIIKSKKLDNKPSNPGYAVEYDIVFKHSSIHIEKNFVESIEDYKRDEEQERKYGRPWKNFEIQEIGDNAYLITWMNPPAHPDNIVKAFFGEDRYGSKQQHYMRYIYSELTTPDEEKEIALHIIDSFQSGFKK